MIAASETVIAEVGRWVDGSDYVHLKDGSDGYGNDSGIRMSFAQARKLSAKLLEILSDWDGK